MTTIINAQNNLAQDLFTITYPTPRVPSITSVGTEAVLTFDTTNVNLTTSASLNGATGQITLSSTSTVYQITAQAEFNSLIPVHLKLVESATGVQVGVAVPINMPLNVVLQPASAGDYEIVIYSDQVINFQYPNQVQRAQLTIEALDGSGAGNPFDQSLNTTDSVEFANITVTGIITATVMTVEHTTVTTTIVETDDIIRTTNATQAGAGAGAIVATAGGISATNGYFSATTNATNSTTGALRVSGGVNVGNDLWVQGGDIRGPRVRIEENTSGFIKKYIDVNTNQIDLVGTTKVTGTLEITNTATISGMSIGYNNGEVSVPGVTVDSDNILVKLNANGGTDGSLIFSGIGTSNTRRAFAIDRNMRLRWYNGATILTALSSTDGSIDYIAGPNGSMAFSTNGYESLIGLTTNSNTIIQAGSEQSIEFRQFTDDVSPTNTIAVLNTTTSTVYSGFEIQAPGGLGPWTWSFDTNGDTTIPGNVNFTGFGTLNVDTIQSLTIGAFSLSGLTGITGQNFNIQVGATYTPLMSDPTLLGSTATGLVVCADAVNWDPAGHSTSTPYLTMYNGTVWSVLG